MPADIPTYLDYLAAPLLDALHQQAEPVPGVPGLAVAPGLQADFPDIETPAALAFVCDIYRAVLPQLRAVLEQRRVDRQFIDQRVLAGQHLPGEPIIGVRDAAGRVVIGPLADSPPPPPVRVPAFLAGDQVTLFGPPDTAKMSINAMNALHRTLPNEPAIVAELVAASGQVPRWGADSEDSKTPLARDLLLAQRNLIGCFDRTISFEDPRTKRRYSLADSQLAIPIKRFPGLTLPDASHLLDGSPLPLHLVDFAMHLFHCWRTPQALVFYVPKLENEEEAAYIKALVEAAEARLSQLHPAHLPGSVKLMVVFESPRSIFRIPEIAAALHPHFVGGSLGWHDFLAATARLLRNDPAYRVPVKADPDIVINHIKESHLMLARTLGPMGALKLGGMYGVLYEAGDSASFTVSMVGYIKDVVTQLRRGLDGFWVAHPDFVRIGIALVQAWRQQQADPTDPALLALIDAIISDPAERQGLHAFLDTPDVPGLCADDPRYLRGVLAANIATSPVIANDDPEEVRYNISQALQYLADWLCGRGCVALPASLTSASGQAVFVRVMDDLATTERSRWEVWAEVHHGRVSVQRLEAILAEEVARIKRGEDRRVQVRWEGRAARWYPVAIKLLWQLMTAPEPPELVSELLLPFTTAPIRQADDPWAAAVALCPGRYLQRGSD